MTPVFVVLSGPWSLLFLQNFPFHIYQYFIVNLLHVDSLIKTGRWHSYFIREVIFVTLGYNAKGLDQALFNIPAIPVIWKQMRRS